ncbi:hypothetical protein R69888_02560 [Paraburkholderia haematera]|uniref:Uncharacterized protein n=1 Tax=Paraburkholderia haematera TaxID=2793077 RepID=A0ABN7LHN1_9BURK|nr:hypothetical protein R69888_02560 [Paraburkholderia haematera]
MRNPARVDDKWENGDEALCALRNSPRGLTEVGLLRQMESTR